MKQKKNKRLHSSSERKPLKPKDNSQKAALLIAGLLMLLTTVSLLFLLLPRQKSEGYIADIYQGGSLIASIPLNEVAEPYTFTVMGEDGCTNEIEVRPGSIGMRSADCPDKICVNQGFISDTRLPITCLPNRIVISLRPADASDSASSMTPDIIAY